MAEIVINVGGGDEHSLIDMTGKSFHNHMSRLESG